MLPEMGGGARGGVCYLYLPPACLAAPRHPHRLAGGRELERIVQQDIDRLTKTSGIAVGSCSLREGHVLEPNLLGFRLPTSGIERFAGEHHQVERFSLKLNFFGEEANEIKRA